MPLWHRKCQLLSLSKEGGDEATRSPAANVSAVPMEKGALSSPEDDSSIDESPSGDGRTILVELPVDDSLPVWQKFLDKLSPSRSGADALQHWHAN